MQSKSGNFSISTPVRCSVAKESGLLEEAELLKAQMLTEAFKLATTAFHDSDKARSWLFSEVATLGFERPVDQLKTIRGYERVKNLLGQIVFGVY